MGNKKQSGVAYNSKAKITITGLASGQNYFFRAASWATDGAINWSVAKKYIVQ